MIPRSAPRFFHLSLVFLFASLAACSSGLTVRPEKVGMSSERIRELHSLLQGLVDKKQIAGGVGLVIRRGRAAYFDAVGLQDVETKAPMAVDTIFRICSMTKPITSVGALMLVEQGKLALNDPVAKFIPEFRNAPVVVLEPPKKEGDPKAYRHMPIERPMTIQHLLTHTSGLTYGLMGREYLLDHYRRVGVSDGLIETEGTMADNVKKLASLPLKFQPGSDWEYGLSADVLGRVIEIVSGETLDSFFQKRIFGPLKMTDTHFRLPPAKRDRLATVYQPKADKAIERLPDGPARRGYASYSATYPYKEPVRYFSGGAGLISTLRDYARFLRMLAEGGKLEGVRLLKEETVALMTRNHCDPARVWIKSHGDGFGLGVGVVTEAAKDQGFGSVGTYSWGGFFHTYFWVDPKEEMIGIVMTQLYPWDHMTLFGDFRKLAYAALVR